MESKPRLPDESVNVSKTHPLIEASWLTIGAAVLVAVFLMIGTFFVELAARFIPIEVETKLAQMIGSHFQTKYELGKKEQVDPVQLLVLDMASHWEGCPYSFRVKIIKQKQPNAFALPGGLIVVTSGLLDLVESENELAFVLGHELGHFYNRDHLRALGRGILLSLTMVTLGQGMSESTVVRIAGSVTDRSFSRKQERKADEFGLELVQKEYGHVAASSRFFEKLRDQKRWADKFANFAGTHPSSETRVEDIHEYAQENGWKTEGKLTDYKKSPSL